MVETPARRVAMTMTVLCCMGAAACGSGTGRQQRPGMPPETQRPTRSAPRGPVHERGGDQVTASVGPPGGVLELSNGAKLEVPAGALGKPKEVTFRVGAPTRVFQHRSNEETIGPILEVQPALTAAPGKRLVLSVPFTRLPSGYSQDDLVLAVETLAGEQRAMGSGGVRTRWRYFSAEVKNGRLQGKRAELPGMRTQFLVSR